MDVKCTKGIFQLMKAKGSKLESNIFYTQKTLKYIHYRIYMYHLMNDMSKKIND